MFITNIKYINYYSYIAIKLLYSVTSSYWGIGVYNNSYMISETLSNIASYRGNPVFSRVISNS